jgi:hypothetical protein
MTDHEIISFHIGLGRRAVACNGWRWLPGMLTMSGLRCVTVGGGVDPQHVRQGRFDIEADAVPDLRDPCTRGGLLELVREAWGLPALSIESHPSTVVDMWRVRCRGETLRVRGVVGFHAEAEALVCTLEANHRREFLHIHAENSAVRTTGNATS